MLRAPTSEAKQPLEQSKTMNREGERAALQLLLKNVIFFYVMKTEGKEYKGQRHYDLNYIQHSTLVSQQRRADILALDLLMVKANQENLSVVIHAWDIFNYLQTFKTGIHFLWLFRIGNKSQLRDALFAAIQGFDPLLFCACASQQIEDYQQQRRKIDKAQLQLVTHIKTTHIDKDEGSRQRYEQLKTELARTQRQLADARTDLSQEKNRGHALHARTLRQGQRIIELETKLGIATPTCHRATQSGSSQDPRRSARLESNPGETTQDPSWQPGLG